MAKKEKIEDPFSAFTIMDGGIPTPSFEEDDDVVAGDPDLLEDEVDIKDPEKASLKKGDKALEKVIKAQENASKNALEPSTKESSEDDTEVEEDIEDSLEGDSAGFKPALLNLAEKGILSFDESTIEDSEDGFDKAIEETVNNRLKKKFEAYGEDAVNFLEFLESGGNPKQYIDTVYSDNSWADYNVDTEATQKITLRNSLELDGYTPEEAEDMINEWSDNGTLEKRAKPALFKMQKLELAQKTEMINSQKAKAEQAKAAEKKYWDDFKDEVSKKDNIKGFKLTPKMRENLIAHMTVIDKKTGKTAYQKAIEGDREASLLFALQSMTNFDISKLEKQVTSKASSAVASLIKNYSKSTKDSLSSGRTDFQKDGDDPFAGFKKMA